MGLLDNRGMWKYASFPPKMREALVRLEDDNRKAKAERQRKEREQRAKRAIELQEEAWLCWAI